MQTIVIQTGEAVAVIITRHGQALAIAKTSHGYTAGLPQTQPVTRPSVAAALRDLRRENMFAGARS